MPANISPENDNFDFSYLEYPEEAIVTLQEAGLTEQELVGRASAELPEHVQSGGYEDINGITISPYYTAKINGENIPVYASVVFICVDDTGTLHFFLKFMLMKIKKLQNILSNTAKIMSGFLIKACINMTMLILLHTKIL